MYDNNISDLIKKMERRLGTRLMNLPKEINKDTWWDNCIKPITLPSFSRLYPHQIEYVLIPSRDKVARADDGVPSNFYYIDEHRLPGRVDIIGLRDLSKERFLKEFSLNPYGVTGSYMNDIGSYSPLDIGLQQGFSDLASLYNNGLRIEFVKPNKIRVTAGNYQDVIKCMETLTLLLYVEHQDLITISPMKMETFEELCLFDLQDFLYQELKFFDGLESIYGGNIDLKMDDWAQAQNNRKDFVKLLKDTFITAGNQFIPIMFTV
jgi:hypothetical protein